MGDKNKVYSAEEVAKHNTKADAWITYQDNVLDVTKFLEMHPGGEDVLLEQAGRDATSAFNDVGHSEDARKTMKQYIIGKYNKPSTSDTMDKKTRSKPTSMIAPPAQKSSDTGLYLALLIVFLAVAYLYLL